MLVWFRKPTLNERVVTAAPDGPAEDAAVIAQVQLICGGIWWWVGGHSEDPARSASIGSVAFVSLAAVRWVVLEFGSSGFVGSADNGKMLESR